MSFIVEWIPVSNDLELKNICKLLIKKVWRYWRGNQKATIEEGQTIQWPKEKGQTMIYKIKIKQRTQQKQRVNSGAPEV